MINFFRKIRQKLLTQNRVTRYLAYALGEILLVGIGILLALQVNNWNEARKNKIQELELLKSLRSDLERDLEDIEYNVSMQKRVDRSGQWLLQAMESNTPNSDSVAIHFARVFMPTTFLNSTSTFETIKSKGVDLVSNPELRNKMIQVFDSQYKFFIDNEKYFHDFNTKIIETILPTRFEEAYQTDLSNLVDVEGSMVPLVFSSLKSDQEFLFFFKSLLNRNQIHYEGDYKRLKDRVEKLKSLLDQEIQKNEKK